jgi:hypothetical protein
MGNWSWIISDKRQLRHNFFESESYPERQIKLGLEPQGYDGISNKHLAIVL